MLDKFYTTFPVAAARSVEEHDFCQLTDGEIKWYEDQGCTLTKVPVPRGGMVLWDSRTVHDNCK